MSLWKWDAVLIKPPASNSIRMRRLKLIWLRQITAQFSFLIRVTSNVFKSVRGLIETRIENSNESYFFMFNSIKVCGTIFLFFFIMRKTTPGIYWTIELMKRTYLTFIKKEVTYLFSTKIWWFPLDLGINADSVRSQRDEC